MVWKLSERYSPGASWREHGMPYTPDVVVALLQNAHARKVFETIAHAKKLQAKDLSRVWQAEQISGEDARHTLEWLKAADLIGEEAAPVADLHTYYVTAQGLAADRQLQRLHAASASGFSPRA
jgi:hypothetical protein